MKSRSLFAPRILKIAIAGTAIAGLAAFGAAPANAELEITSSVSQMNILGFDAEVAAANGYELRVNEDGDSVSVPMSNAEGDFEGATGVVIEEGASTARGVVGGPCGTSWVYFQAGNTQFRTGYQINSNLGQAGSHVWNVTVSTIAGMGGQVGAYPMTGVAPLFSPSWQGIRTIKEQYTSKGSAVAGGTAITTTGIICGSNGPTANY